MNPRRKKNTPQLCATLQLENNDSTSVSSKQNIQKNMVSGICLLHNRDVSSDSEGSDNNEIDQDIETLSIIIKFIISHSSAALRSPPFIILPLPRPTSALIIPFSALLSSSYLCLIRLVRPLHFFHLLPSVLILPSSYLRLVRPLHSSYHCPPSFHHPTSASSASSALYTHHTILCPPHSFFHSPPSILLLPSFSLGYHHRRCK
jgi:hypothetical protein